MAHYIDATVARRFRKLVRQAPEGSDVFLLLEEGAHLPDGLAERVYRFDFAELRKMARSVTGDRISLGSCHLRAIDFSRRFPGYRHYWFIEYDVVYTGDWRDFFRDFEGEDADLLAAHVRLAKMEPDWPLLDTFSPGDEPVDADVRVLAFVAIHRISARGLKAVAEKVAAGWVGNLEIVVPTAIAEAGMSIVDFGGSGPYTPRHLQNKHYLDYRQLKLKGIVATLRYRPPVAVPMIRNMIYHPRKTEPGLWRRSLVDPLRNALWAHPRRAAIFLADTLWRTASSHTRSGMRAVARTLGS